MTTSFEQEIIDSAARTDLLIWWTGQEECEAIYALHEEDDENRVLPATVPEYIRLEFRSRYGRAGRGRLWCDGQFSLPGFLTDLKLNFINDCKATP